MKRLVACLIGLVVITMGLFVPGLIPTSSNPAGSVSDPTTITSYVADFDLGANGDLRVVERITVEFPQFPSRHGIFRFWDRHDVNDSNARRDVDNIEITMDDAPVQVEMSSQDRGRYTVARIGSPTSYVTPGSHTYEIRYTIDGVLIEGEGVRPSAFYWNLIPGGWAQRIESATLTVQLPANAEAVQCGIGVGTEPPACDVTGAGTTDLTIVASDLAPNTPVTLRTGLAIEKPPTGNALPWAARFDPVLGRHPVLLVLVGLLTAATSALGLKAARHSVEATPPFPLMYGPPDGIGPAQASYILHETNREDAFVGTLMHAAERRAIELERDAGWSIRDRNDRASWNDLDPVTQGIKNLTGGGTFHANKSDVAAGKRLKSEMARFEGDVRNWALQSGNLAKAGLGDLGIPLVVIAAGLTVAIAVWNPFSMSILGLIPGGFVAGAISLVFPGAATIRTPQGRDLWSRVGGFQRVLSTPSSKERFDFAGRQELYLTYLPWAVAFGCADAWADKYRTEMGVEPPLPIYFGPGHVGMTSSRFVDSMVSDFRSTLDSAISSYEATQRSSSSGGGGFSGGGGGGGGGGGSW